MRKYISSLLLCCLLVVSLPLTCGAQATYQVTESQLTQLDQNLIQLSINNQNLLTQLSQSKQDLATASNQLATLKAQLITLQSQTQIALQQQQTAQTSLQTANASFVTLEKAEQAKIKSVTLQRDIGYLSFVLSLIAKR